MKHVLTAFAAGSLLLSSAAMAQAEQRPVPDYGSFQAIDDAFEKPDPSLRYRILFDVSEPPRSTAAVNPGLDRAARLVNMLHRYGVKIQPGDIAVVLHGPPSRSVLTAAAYAKRYENAENPNVELIRQLTRAGVVVRLCGQSMLASGYSRDEINPDVKIDLAAISTIATLQMRGYALVQD